MTKINVNVLFTNRVMSNNFLNPILLFIFLIFIYNEGEGKNIAIKIQHKYNFRMFGGGAAPSVFLPLAMDEKDN